MHRHREQSGRHATDSRFLDGLLLFAPLPEALLESLPHDHKQEHRQQCSLQPLGAQRVEQHPCITMSQQSATKNRTTTTSAWLNAKTDMHAKHGRHARAADPQICRCGVKHAPTPTPNSIAGTNWSAMSALSSVADGVAGARLDQAVDGAAHRAAGNDCVTESRAQLQVCIATDARSGQLLAARD